MGPKCHCAYLSRESEEVQTHKSTEQKDMQIWRQRLEGRSHEPRSSKEMSAATIRWKRQNKCLPQGL